MKGWISTQMANPMTIIWWRTSTSYPYSWQKWAELCSEHSKLLPYSPTQDNDCESFLYVDTGVLEQMHDTTAED